MARLPTFVATRRSRPPEGKSPPGARSPAYGGVMGPRRLCLSGAAVAFAIGFASLARAASAVLDMECRDLDPGDFAAVEATARAELSEAGGWDLNVLIACGPRATTVRVRSGSGPPVERQVAGALDEGPSLDELLAALHAL